MNKKTLLSILYLCFVLSLPAQVGVRAGISLPSQTFKIDGVKPVLNTILGFTFAAIYEFNVAENLSIQPELVYIQKGFGQKIDYLGTLVKSELRLNYIEVPVLAKYFFGNESVGGYLATGPTFGYAITGFSDENGNKQTYNDNDWETFNRFEFGGSVGGGIGVPLSAGKIFLDFRYQFSLNNLYDFNDLGGNITGGNRGVNFSIGYQLAVSEP